MKYNSSLLHSIEDVKNGKTKRIGCYRLNLIDLPPNLFDLDTLEELFLYEANISMISHKIGNLKNLKKLILTGNNLTTLPEEIGTLSNLEYLDLSKNSFTELPVDVTKIKSLTTLNISYNQIKNLTDDILDSSTLEVLDLQGNSMIEIPEVIYEIKSLRKLCFSRNSGRELGDINYYQNSIEISNKICQLEKLEQFIVNPNIFHFPPPEIISKGVESIKNFFKQIESEGEDNLYEAKLIIVGEPGAGKTSLTRKLIDINSPLPNDDETTKGIDIHNLEFEIDNNRTFKINIWDFGGQEIYHSTHQFFLTKRSLYLLVCDTRKEDTSYNYWLQVIELLSNSSPVVLIHNEKQDRTKDINWSALRKRFDNLLDHLKRTNFATNRGVNELMNTIKYEIQRLPHVGDRLPKTWVRVREEIKKIAEIKNYITDKEFYDICRHFGIKDYSKAQQLSNYFHDLGVYLHFIDGSILERTIILNNSWATNAVYKVFDDPNIKDNLKGRFIYDDIVHVWSEQIYNEKKEELLALMMKFELCYKVPDSSIYIIPELLPVNEPDISWDETKSIKIRFVYEFMPKGIITKFIVRMNNYIMNERLVWKEGVVLEWEYQKALIKQSYNKKEIQISVIGNQPRIFLTIISAELDRINRSYSNLICTKYIPCNCDDCKNTDGPHFYEYSDIMRRIEKGKPTIECAISFEDINVNSLIENIFESQEDSNSRIEKLKSKVKTVRNSVFISYSHKDERMLNSFKRHLGLFKGKIDFWDDTMISVGENWDKRIKSAISHARIAILFLSADFFNSKYILENELPPLLESAESNGTMIFVVVLKPCLVDEYPLISRYQFINDPADPIIQMTEAEQEFTWVQLVKEVKKYFS